MKIVRPNQPSFEFILYYYDTKHCALLGVLFMSFFTSPIIITTEPTPINASDSDKVDPQVQFAEQTAHAVSSSSSAGMF